MVPLPSPQQLRYLIALAETRHFGRAAESCAGNGFLAVGTPVGGRGGVRRVTITRGMSGRRVLWQVGL